MEALDAEFQRLLAKFSMLDGPEELEQMLPEVNTFLASWKAAKAVKPKKKLIKKKVSASEPAPSPPAPESEPVPAPEAPKKVGRPKKTEEEKEAEKAERSAVLASSGAKAFKGEKVCNARIYGDVVEIPGMKVKAYKPKECEKKAKFCVGDEDEGVQYLCTTCHTHYAFGKKGETKEWLGFFDDGVVPAKAHLIGSEWHKRKLAGKDSSSESSE